MKTSGDDVYETKTYYCSEECWNKRGRIVGSQAGSGCPFYNADRMCVPPGPDQNMAPCSLPKGWIHNRCYAYPIQKREQSIWEVEFSERKKIEAEMSGGIGKCKICGNTHKLNLNQVCSICILAIERANKLFDEREKDTLICDWCMKQVKKGEAYLTVRKTYLCCIDDWKDFAK